MASELKPDVIVLDFAMPMLNGIEAAQEILKAMPRVPIVLYTLHKNSQLELDAHSIGISRVISKGEDFNALIATLQELFVAHTKPLGPLGLDADSAAELPTVPESAVDLQTNTPRKPGVPEL
jgi:DNA-binding NarL/FixJ family response regulator